MPTVSVLNVCTHAVSEMASGGRPTTAVVAFHPKEASRFATGGGDNNVSMWRLSASFASGVEQLSLLQLHTSGVGVVRWNPDGLRLASVDNDGRIGIWKQSSESSSSFKELWLGKIHRCSPEEVADIAWDKDVLIVACLKGRVHIYDPQKEATMQSISLGNSFVQGVGIDPLNKYLAVHAGKCCVYVRNNKMKWGGRVNLSKHPKNKSNLFACGSALSNIMRRPSFSPDGLFLCAVSGQFVKDGKSRPAVHLFHRSNLQKKVSSFVLGHMGDPSAASFSPKIVPLESKPQAGSLSHKYGLQYAMYLAVISGSSLFVFDTSRVHPILCWKDNDARDFIRLSWSCEGSSVIISDKEGFLAHVAL